MVRVYATDGRTEVAQAVHGSGVVTAVVHVGADGTVDVGDDRGRLPIVGAGRIVAVGAMFEPHDAATQVAREEQRLWVRAKAGVVELATPGERWVLVDAPMRQWVPVTRPEVTIAVDRR